MYATLKNALLLLLLLLNFLLLPELVVYRTQNEDNGSHDATQLGDESHRSLLRFDDSWRVEKKNCFGFLLRLGIFFVVLVGVVEHVSERSCAERRRRASEY